MKEKTISVEAGLFSSDLWLGARFAKGQAIADLLFLCTKGTGSIPGFPVSIKEDTLCKRWKWSKTAVLELMIEVQDRGVLQFGSVKKGSQKVFTVLAMWSARSPQWKPPEDLLKHDPEVLEEMASEEVETAESLPSGNALIPTIDEWLGMAQDEGFPKEAAESSFYSYEAKGWMIGKTRIRDWRSALKACHGYWRERNPGYVPPLANEDLDHWPPRGDWEGALGQLYHIPDYEKRIWKRDPSRIPLPTRAEILRLMPAAHR